MTQFISNPMVLAAVYTILALVCTFAGYRLQKLGIAVAAFGISYSFARILISHFVGYSEAVTGCSIIFGLVCAGMSYNLYIVGLFFLMMGLSVFTCWNQFSNQWIGVSVGVAVGIPLGFLAVRMNKPILIISTALFGGVIAVRYGLVLLDAYTSISPISDTTALLIGAVLGVIGIIVQYKTIPVSVRG